MTPSIFFTLALVACLLVLFLIGRFRAESVALGGMLVLGIASYFGLTLLPNIKSLWAGYSSNAVISLIAVMLVAVGLQTAGLMDSVSRWIARYGNNQENRVTGLLMLVAGIVSAVIQNTAVVALFLPVATVLSRQLGISLSRLAMPIAIAAAAGGTMTLVGTAPLILVQDLIPMEHARIGFTAPFVTGLIILLASILIHLYVGQRFLPSRSVFKSLSRGEQYRIRPRLRGVSIDAHSRFVGRPFGMFERVFRVTVAAYARDGKWVYTPYRQERIPKSTIIAVFATDEELADLVKEPGINSCKLKPGAFTSGTADFVEMLVPAGSPLAGQRIRNIAIRKNYGIAPLVISSGGKLAQYNLRNRRLREGDMIYGYAAWENIKNHHKPRELWLLGTAPTPYNREKAPHAVIGLFLGAVGLMVGLPSSLAFSLGVAWMVVARLFSFHDVIREVNWSTVALLGAMIPIGSAVSYSGSAAFLAELLAQFFYGMHFFEMCLFLSFFALLAGMAMTNVGAATVMIPLAAQVAVAMDLNVDSLALAVAMAVSNTFVLSSSQVNTFVQASGEYRARDYFTVGIWQTLSYALIISLSLYLGVL